VASDDISDLLATLDLDNDGTISFQEFLKFMLKFTEKDEESGSPGKETVKTTDKSGRDITEKISSSGSKHTYSDEEKACFAKVINDTLKDDELCTTQELVPINPDNEDLFLACDNGIIFCKLVNAIQKDTVDERVLRKSKNVFEVKENLNCALSAIKAVGCKVIGVDPELILKHTEHLILGLLW